MGLKLDSIGTGGGGGINEGMRRAQATVMGLADLGNQQRRGAIADGPAADLDTSHAHAVLHSGTSPSPKSQNNPAMICRPSRIMGSKACSFGACWEHAA